jgi:hypothetical protein
MEGSSLSLWQINTFSSLVTPCKSILQKFINDGFFLDLRD